MKKLRVMLIIVCVLSCLVGCSSEETPKRTLVSENQIVSANVEYRTRTTNFGGIRGYDPYLTIMYVEEDGTLNVEDHQLREDYTEFLYEIILRTSEDENKVVRYEEGQKEILEIYLTEQLYKQIFNEMNS